jgi:nitrogen-specific signal transduction histidine kinase
VANSIEAVSRGSRASTWQSRQELGLGIAAEIARVHDGMLGVTSTSIEARFTFLMPRRWSRHGTRRPL